MNLTIFYHDSAKGYRTMTWQGELSDAQDWFERNHDLSKVTYCGVALTTAVLQST